MKSQVAAFKASQSLLKFPAAAFRDPLDPLTTCQRPLLSMVVCFVVIRYQANVQELKPTVCQKLTVCRKLTAYQKPNGKSLHRQQLPSGPRYSADSSASNPVNFVSMNFLISSRTVR